MKSEHLRQQMNPKSLKSLFERDQSFKSWALKQLLKHINIKKIDCRSYITFHNVGHLDEGGVAALTVGAQNSSRDWSAVKPAPRTRETEDREGWNRGRMRVEMKEGGPTEQTGVHAGVQMESLVLRL